MKTSFKILAAFMALFVSSLFGGGVAFAIGAPVAAGLTGGSVLSIVGSFLPKVDGLHADVYREVWTNEVIKVLNSGLKDSFLDGIPDLSQYVSDANGMEVINNTYFGVEPDVLINNNTYPIPMQTLDGENIPIALDKYQTKVTPITDDELYALAYDKMGAVKEAHGNALIRNRLKKAIHALAPTSNATKTPVILTTGATTPDGTRKRLQWLDIITFREKCAAAGMDLDNMRLVLCSDHVNDLILADKDLYKTLADWKTGSVPSSLGFEIRSFIANPYFDTTTLAKKSFGATIDAAKDRQASVIFVPSLCRKAMGSTKMYYREAATNPEYQQNQIAFRNNFIAMPTKQQYLGAIVSAVPA